MKRHLSDNGLYHAYKFGDFDVLVFTREPVNANARASASRIAYTKEGRRLHRAIRGSNKAVHRRMRQSLRDRGL